MTTSPERPIDALVVVSFGGPEGPEDVVPFLQNVTRGRNIPDHRLAQVGSHYQLFGGVSPLNAQCRQLVEALQTELTRRDDNTPVYWGNRNWDPMLEDTVGQMAADGVQRAAAFVTSAYSSWSGCRQYLDDIARARAAVGPTAPPIEKLRQYHDHPGFVEPFVDATRAALLELADSPRADAELLFTAHSIPTAMAEGCDYRSQLLVTADLISRALGDQRPWELVFQSRSGAPHVPWLEPDVGDRLRQKAEEGSRAVVVVPIGFTSDHMEVVYDLDTEARRVADEAGVAMARAATPGTDPRFVAMVLALLDEQRRGDQPVALGPAGPRPVPCRPDCCPAG
ncbi:MAG: ferrochelatase [Acidimicrobiales bacterium]